MHDHLSPARAAAVASTGRLLLRGRKITHHQHSLLQVLLWGRPAPARPTSPGASFTRLEDRAAMAREIVASVIRRLAELGLVAITKRRVHVPEALP